jgi:hypothetical protein
MRNPRNIPGIFIFMSEHGAEERARVPFDKIMATMLMEADKVMFEIYRESAYTGKYRVVYFTELNENNKESEINRAMSGEHFYDGFIKNYKKDEAKEIIDSLLRRLNDGEKVTPDDIEKALGSHIP